MAEDTLQPTLRTQVILYGALLACVPIYGVMGYLMAHAATAGVPVPVPMPMPIPIIVGLGAVALFETALLPFLRQRLLPPAEGGVSLDESFDLVRAAEALARLQVAQIVTWAICESIAILGLVLVVMTHDLRYFFGFGALALLNFALYRPSLERIAGVVRAAARP